MKVTLKVWRQKNRTTPGGFQTYTTPELNANMSFLEMLDVVNEDLANRGEEPIAFDHDCREDISDLAMDAAQCIGCGACVAACKNASAMLFVAAKISHLNLLPQGQPGKDRRVKAMVARMDEEGFGACTVTGSCEAVCPKEISL